MSSTAGQAHAQAAERLLHLLVLAGHDDLRPFHHRARGGVRVERAPAATRTLHAEARDYPADFLGHVSQVPPCTPIVRSIVA